MLSKRIIACLDVRNGKLAKSVKFVDTKDIGDPVEKAQEYYEEGGERKLREVSAETKATLNKAIQMKLYDLGLGGTPNGKKVQAAMGLFSKIVMTIPIKSAAAAFVSGAIFGNSQLKSNPNFGEASLMEAMKFLFTNREKGNVIADYFNIYQEGDLRMLQKLQNRIPSS